MEGIINVLKNHQNNINNGLKNFKKSPKERITKEYIETRQELLERDWSLFGDMNCKLYENYPPEKFSKVVDEIYYNTEDTYITYKGLLKTTFNSLTKANQLVQSKSSEGASNSSALVKLPKITIPTFSGTYSEWTTFYDLFTSLIHKNETLDNVQKLHYLKTHLTGEAEQLIRHTPITDANYIQCWTLLEKRYSNKKYLSNCILQKLFSIKRMQLESATSLKELIDTACDCLNALKNLGIDVSTWDVIVIHILTFKLDNETRKDWELSLCESDSNNDLPTFEHFKGFIESRFRALEFVAPRNISSRQFNCNLPVHKPRTMVALNANNLRCEYCSEHHKLCFCKKFGQQTCDERRNFVAKNKICFNCLGSNHTVEECRKQTTCRLCHKRHHSLLHYKGEGGVLDNAQSSIGSATGPSAGGDRIVACLSTGEVPKPRQVLLATALIKAESRPGVYQTVRALLDQGSQACFITEATVQFLRLKRIHIKGCVSGLGQNSSTMVKYMVQFTVQSRVDPEFKIKINAYVLSKITSYLPESVLNTQTFDWLNIDNRSLADPEFNRPNKIDILLGADAYSSIIQEGIVKNPSGTLIAQNTSLGWILSGVIESSGKKQSNKVTVMHAKVTEDDILTKFWEIEEQISSKKILTPEEKRCEELFSATTRRDTSGRYIVKLPFRDEDPPCQAGNSRAIAENIFKALERRLERNTNLKERYTEVIHEYLLLGHMRKIKEYDSLKDTAVYLPHHAVIREDKSTTKVRVVFNASKKNSNGISLNDTLMVGPTLQADLRHTVLRWRMHPIALVADIVKMYRQIKVAESDAKYQRILWRDSTDKKIEDYELMTVTFGTASAPFQAVRSLHQVAYDEGKDFPLAVDKVLNSYYMDDLMTGCKDIEEGIEIYKQMTGLLGRGGFTLQKWNSNSSDLTEMIKSLERDTFSGQIEQTEVQKSTKEVKETVAIKLDSNMKILGLTWNRSEDTFLYTVNLPAAITAPVTKRAIISEIGQLFDPLGWLAPSVILAKAFIQKLWIAGVSWDEEVSTDLKKEWNTYREELFLLTKIQIPRWLHTRTHDVLEIHGFSDASKIAYSAAVYLRVTDADGSVHVSLLVAKTRVAPVKQISIPRLELCGAVLLCKLLVDTAEVLNIPRDKIRAWTDSTVVLSWLNCHPSKWKTFVANRTSEILTSMKVTQWCHVPTKDNPADCASRGLLPSMLVDNTMWFSGPSFLKQNIIEYKWPKGLSTDQEEAIKVHNVTVNTERSIFERFSSLDRLVRVIAYCRRFLLKDKNTQGKGIHLQSKDLRETLECCIRQTQRDVFASELLQLQNKGYIESKSSILKSLCPYLDNKNLIRARGRIEKAQLEDETKQPIILPKSNHLTNLIIADAHIKTLHGGPQLMTNYLRSAYWIIGVRNLVKQVVRKCVICARQKASTRSQLMSSLPTVRCTPARPFLHSGVDYAGPINIRTTKGRGHKSYKGYICVFVCMATRALHLEVVTDLSTQAFLAAFRRFVSRRGHCAKIWSDNGTTFVGASRELQQLAAIQTSIAEHLEANGTEWHFIPPHSPNFGGLWEAGVKSTKFHLKRIIGDTTLTYEEMATLLCQVEACLNSRPMSVINVDDPGEPLPLTPGHFLIGEALVNIPEDSYETSNVGSLTRWQYVQRMVQSFWKRWSQEYLSNIMNRYKWSSCVPEPNVGDIVLVKEDNMPPSRWLLGRVIEKHPGNDEITRVVTLRTKLSTIKRPTSKLCILPVSNN